MPDNYGNLLIPAQAAGTDEAPGDPLLDVLLDFFKAVLNAQAGAAYRSIGIGKETSTVVDYTFAHDPEKGYFDKTKTPALYLYRAYNNPSEWIAQDYYVRSSQLVLLWVPPEVHSQKQRMRLMPFGNAIQSMLDNVLEPTARDPSWVVASDTDPRAALWGSLLWRYAKIWGLDMGRSEWTTIVIPTDMTGMGNDAQPPRFPAVKTTIDLMERNQGELPEDQDMHDADVTLQTAVTDATFGPLDYLVFDFALSVASVSPSTGSQAGGTTLVILGTGFKVDPPTITVGGVDCTDVDVSAPGALTCKTPPGNPFAGALDVVVTNPTGDSVTAAAAFTYSADVNLISAPNSFSSWVNDTCVTVPAQALAPDGVSLADKVREDATNSSRAVFHTLSQTAHQGQDVEFVVYAKAAGRHWIALELDPQGDFWNFNLQTGSLGSPFDDDGVVKLEPSISPAGNGWYRCSIRNRHVTQYAGGIVDQVGIYLEDRDNSTGYQGDGVSGVYLWGAYAIIHS